MKPSLKLSIAAATLTLSSGLSRAVVIFDGISDVAAHSVASTPNSFMGEAVNLDAAGFSAALNSISSFEVGVGNVTGAGITARPVRLNMWVYQTYTPSATATPVFSNQIGTPGSPSFVFDFPSFTLANGTLLVATLTMGTPLVLTPTSGTTIGLALNWQVDNGAGFVSLNGFTTPVHANVAPTVGSNATGGAPAFGYYRNAANEADGNFLGTSARNIGNDSGLLLRINGPNPVPEPAATTLGLVFGVTLLSRRRR